jgi:2-methylisocitrate lyase-like PEP mutase family enzyme
MAGVVKTAGPLLTPMELRGVGVSLTIAGLLAAFRQAAAVERAKTEEIRSRTEAANMDKQRDAMARLERLAKARSTSDAQMRVLLMNRGVYPGSDAMAAPYVAAAARQGR